jgi:hypothetical protein
VFKYWVEMKALVVGTNTWRAEHVQGWYIVILVNAN